MPFAATAADSVYQVEHSCFFILVICISVSLKTVFIMVKKWKHGFDKDSWYRHRLMVLNQTYGTESLLQTWTHGIDMDSLYWQRLVVWT